MDLSLRLKLDGDVTIVPLAVDHIEDFHSALDAVARERRYLLLLEAPPLEATRAFVLESLASGNPHFVASASGKVVGWCDIRRQFFASVAHRGALGMGVIPAYRGRGIGLQLLAATVEKAGQEGFARIEFEVRADNAPAIALYEKFGFVREGVVQRAVRIDGDYVDAIAMAMLLG
jgi:ribosomal protein S18 acetylase RimI-like enzyme